MQQFTFKTYNLPIYHSLYQSMAAVHTTKTNDAVLAQILILNCEHIKTANISQISCKDLSKLKQK